MRTEMELTLEQTQQGVSYEVSVFTMNMEILLETTSNKLMVVTRWFTLVVLSALRRSDNENMLSRSSRIRRILKDGSGDFRYSDTIHSSFSRLQIKKGVSMSVQKSQVHKMAKITRWRKEIVLG
ncbi:hypothetical protein Tco_1063852 [Tanacetum coccineum]